MSDLRPSELLKKTEIPEQSKGPWKIARFTIDQEQASFFNLRQMVNGHGCRAVKEGTYTKLVYIKPGQDESRGWVRSDPMMSDTPAELRDHYDAARYAKDHCLIAGLGLGIIAEACLRKPEVTKVTVLEIDEDIIAMVAPYLFEKWGKDRLEILHCNALQWKPPKEAYYGMAWFDIWPTMDEDNLEEMHLLHRRYGRKAEWKGSWGRALIERERRRYQNSRYW